MRYTTMGLVQLGLHLTRPTNVSSFLQDFWHRNPSVSRSVFLTHVVNTRSRLGIIKR